MKKLFLLTVILTFTVTLASTADEQKMICGPKNSDLWKLSNHVTSALTEAKMGSKKGRVDVRLISSSGPYESIKMLYSHNADFAVVDALSAYNASMGKGKFSALLRNDIVALAVLGLEVEHYVLVSSTLTENNLTGITEKMLYLGKRGDYRRYAASVSLKSLGIETFYDGGAEWDYNTSAELMLDGSIDGAVYMGIPPIEAVTYLKNIMGNALVVLNVDYSVITKMQGFFPVWFPYTISANTYPKQGKPIITVAKPILLVSTRSLDKKSAKGFVSSLFDKKSIGYLSSNNFPITEEMNHKYKIIEYHPGANEFFDNFDGGGK